MHGGNWDPDRLAAVLASILRETGITTQEELADAAGMKSRSQVNRWIHGKHRPGYDALKTLAIHIHFVDRRPDLARELMDAAGYKILGEPESWQDAASAQPELTSQDEWERLVLADETLPYHERADIVRRSRRVRAELYPALEPRPADQQLPGIPDAAAG
jgi:transcriptional regulator with XRE-family HTH domain